MNYIKIINWFWAEVPYTDGYRPLYGILFFALVDGINKNQWRQNTPMDYERIINKCRFTKEVYLKGRQWLMENNFILYIPGKNNNQMAQFSIGPAVGNPTSNPTGTPTTNEEENLPVTIPVRLPIIKQETNKPIKDKHKTFELNISFENFYDLYDKKRGNIEKLKKAWLSLTNEERQLAMDHIPKYKLSQPDKQYRKDPATYLNNKSFNDEILIKNEQTNGNNTGKHYTNKQAGTCLAADRFFGGLAELADQ